MVNSGHDLRIVRIVGFLLVHESLALGHDLEEVAVNTRPPLKWVKSLFIRLEICLCAGSRRIV